MQGFTLAVENNQFPNRKQFMLGIQHFEAFILAGITLNITPGNDTIYILSRTIAQGRKAGLVSALGIGTGAIIHTMFAAFGLALIIAQSVLLFNIIKYAGAAYLTYLGFRMLLAKESTFNLQRLKADNYWRIYWQAVVTNVLNPKVALFFISFLPQFVDPTYSESHLSFLVLGLTFTGTGTAWCLILALFASLLANRLIKNNKASTWITRTCGVILIGLGIKVALGF